MVECDYMHRLVVVVVSLCLFIGVSAAAGEVGATPPQGVTEIHAPEPLEISGVAAIPGGYAVVGDDTNDHGRIWPGGARWDINPKVKGPESLDVGFGPDGEEVWFVLGENKRRLSDLSGGTYKFPKAYKEICGRGLEGLAVRKADTGWEVAVLWEGGFYDTRKKKCDPPGVFAKPKVAIVFWSPGKGTEGPVKEFELDVPELGNGERFRAPDLVWHDDELLVLLASEDRGKQHRSHTWLHRFTLDGAAVGEPLKLEEQWGPYREGKNWEALDWTLDGTGLVMGYDAKRGHRALAVFAFSPL